MLELRWRPGRISKTDVTSRGGVSVISSLVMGDVNLRRNYLGDILCIGVTVQKE